MSASESRRKTFVGAAVSRGDGTEHTIWPNKLSRELTELQCKGFQVALDERFRKMPDVTGCSLRLNGRLYVDLRPLSPQRQAQVLKQVLEVLRDLQLHDPAPGLDSKIPYLR